MNFVDERFELTSLVFRLAGREEFNSSQTKYQHNLAKEFSRFESHPAIQYTIKNLKFGGDAVFGIAVHLEKQGSSFALTNNIDAILSHQGGIVRWTQENITAFVGLLNDFYKDTNFNDFYQRHKKYYDKHNKRFEKTIYNRISFDWFRKYGLNPDNLRIIISPSESRYGYGSTVYGSTPKDNINYAGLAGIRLLYPFFLAFIVHEFCHAFANPIASRWYYENEAFRKWCDDSVNTERPNLYGYTDGHTMALEYVTRSFTRLYMVENTGAAPSKQLGREKKAGFPHIDEVYEMVKMI